MVDETDAGTAPEASGPTTGDGCKPTGRVVGIIRRNWRTRGYAGSLKPDQKGSQRSAACLFVPVERRFPMIRIQTRQVDAPYPPTLALSAVVSCHRNQL